VELEEEGISVEIIDPLTLNPFDKETIVNSVKKTGRLVVAHEAPYKFGVSAEIITEVIEACMGDLKAPPVRACSRRTAVPSGSSEWRAILSKNDIRKGVYKVLGKPYPDAPEFHAPSGIADIFGSAPAEGMPSTGVGDAEESSTKADPDGSVFSTDGAIMA
jgi:hypothetical protein